MNVLYLGNTLNKSTGWGRFSRELIDRFVDSGINATLLMEEPSDYPNEQVILRGSWHAPLSALSVRKIIKENKIDLIHSLEVNSYGIIADLANIGLGVPHVITTTGAYSVRPLYRPATKYVTKRAYKNADRILCISEYVKDEIQKVVPLPQLRVVTLGVDVDLFSGERKPGKERFILGVGNMCYRKGYHVSVEGFARVAKQIPDVKYYIAGAIDEYSKNLCDEIIKREGIEGRVVFLGSVDDAELRELYLSAELFILTSVNKDMHFEGFGLVFLEAAAAGLPVIGTTGNGIASAMAEGRNGLLVPQNDPEATGDAILKIVTDKEVQKAFAKGSIEFAQENNWDSVAKKYLEIYQEIYHDRQS